MARGPGRPKHPISRVELLSAARKTFAEHGYAGATMARIADSAGLKKASLFHHFRNKEALYHQVLATTLGDLGQLVAIASLSDGSFLTRMDQLGDLVVEYLGTRPGAGRLLLHEIMSQRPSVGDPHSQAVTTTLALIAAFLDAGIAEGVVPPQSTRHLTISIVGVHLIWFSADTVVGPFAGGSVYDQDLIASRKVAIRQHVRSLCQIEPDVTSIVPVT